jgi:hypothetical protein
LVAPGGVCRARALLPAWSVGAGFTDVLDTPALMSPLASRSLLQAVTRAGDRIVAVGQRGHIVVSVDGGTTWKQSPVPVSSDLTAVFFADDKHGWAVGHGGVILHTGDGGERWDLQLNGVMANDLLLAAMERREASEPASEEAKKFLAEARRYKEQAADKTFLASGLPDERRRGGAGQPDLQDGRRRKHWGALVRSNRESALHLCDPSAMRLVIAGEGDCTQTDRHSASKRFRCLTTAVSSASPMPTTRRWCSAFAAMSTVAPIAAGAGPRSMPVLPRRSSAARGPRRARCYSPTSEGAWSPPPTEESRSPNSS